MTVSGQKPTSILFKIPFGNAVGLQLALCSQFLVGTTKQKFSKNRTINSGKLFKKLVMKAFYPSQVQLNKCRKIELDKYIYA